MLVVMLKNVLSWLSGLRLTVLFLVLAPLTSVALPVLPWCGSKRVLIRPIAVVAPGMMRLDTVYAVVNTSREPCLFSTDQFRLHAHFMQQSFVVPVQTKLKLPRSWFVLSPVSSINSLPLKQVVWFDVKAHAQGNRRLQYLTWDTSRLKSSDRVSYPMPQYAYKPVHSNFFQGVSHWAMDKSCRINGRVMTLNDKTLIDFNRTLSCG
jgi:hypothetical protein